jgi:hypothetical protein
LKISVRLLLIIVIVGALSSLSPAFAGTVAPPGLASNDQIYPGTPLPDYSWTQLFFSTLGPDDPGFFDLGNFGFLMTGNTMYNFNGDPTYLTYVFGTPPTSNLVGSSPAVAPAPEPGTISLMLLCCAGLLLYRVKLYRLRFRKNAINS